MGLLFAFMSMKKTKDTRLNLFILAVVGVSTLLLTTYQMCQLSTWIVRNDHVWAEMDRTGYESEHFAAELFHLFGFASIGVVIEAIAGLIFLSWLWQHLFVPRAETEFQQPNESEEMLRR